MDAPDRQKTIAKTFSFKGVGLHTGRRCQAVFHPAPENHGIRFVRTDLPGKPEFRAVVDNVVDVIRGTTLGGPDERVYTIEHILSALHGLGIDNARIELSDNEPPVADGSALPFVRALKEAGISELEAARRYFRVQSPIEYVSNQTRIKIEPSERLEVYCEVTYDHPLIKSQFLTFTEDMSYEKEIAPARTYCFDYEIEALKKKGLAKGGSLDNAIVIGPTGIYNSDTALRFQDEIVRHKILDLMGDLLLLGAPLKARVTAVRCGHGHNVKFLRQLMESEAALHPADAR